MKKEGDLTACIKFNQESVHCFGGVVNVGLDVGTSTCVVAWHDGKDFEQLRVRGGGPSSFAHSYVCLDSDGNTLGEGVKARDYWYASTSADDQKRALQTRRRFKMYIGAYSPDFPRPNRTPPECHTPEGLTTAITRYLLREASEQASVPFDPACDKAVVTVPHGWVHDPEKRTATKNAVIEAGWKVKTVVSEPVAAAAYYVHKRSKSGDESPRNQVYLVCDMGGGTFDLSLVQVQSARHLLVIDAECNNWAGDRLDALIAEDLTALMCSELQDEVPLTADRLLEGIHSDLSLRKFMRLAEQLKIDMSATFRQHHGDDDIWSDRPEANETQLPPMQYRRMVELCRPLLRQNCQLVRDFLERNASHKPDRVVLVGGVSPFAPLRKAIQQTVTALYGKDLAFDFLDELEGQLAIARGAALFAKDMMTFQEVLLHPVGIISTPSQGQIASGRWKAGENINTKIFERKEPYPCRVDSGDRDIRYIVRPRQKTILFSVSYDDKLRLSEMDPKKVFDWEIALSNPPIREMRLELRFAISDTGDLTIQAIEPGGGQISSISMKIER